MNRYELKFKSAVTRPQWLELIRSHLAEYRLRPTQVTDHILVAAYQQDGAVQKAAAFLSERTGRAVTKDKVQSAPRRSGGVSAVVRKRSCKTSCR